MMSIETKNLNLIPCDVDLLQTAIEGDVALASKLGVRVADQWTSFGIEPLKYSLAKLLESGEGAWWTYFPIHTEGKTLIGSGGYKGGPTSEGTVEIGYEIAPDYRNKGLATEMATGLIGHAFSDNRVTRIIAYTLGEENASVKVLSKSGFVKVEEINDPEDGFIWKWELEKDWWLSGKFHMIPSRSRSESR